MANNFPLAGAGSGGSGFQLFTQSDNQSGIYADAAARDVYFGANPSELARLDENESLIIKLLDNGSGEVAYQQRASGMWVDVTSLVQGETGPAGATGNSYFFESIAARDAFFNTIGNEQLLMQELPVVVNEIDTVTTFFWNGGDSPVSYDETLWRPASLRTAPGTLFLGEGGASISSGNVLLNFVEANGGLAYVTDVKYDDTGSDAPVILELGARFTFPFTDVFDTVLADPEEMLFLSSFSNLIRSYSIRPATTGELRIQAWAGTSDTDPVILDDLTIIEVGDIGNVIKIELTNPNFTTPGSNIFIRFSGIQLDGGLQTSGEFIGQTVPWLEADFHPAPEKEIALSGEVISEDPRNFYFAKGGDDSKDGTTMENALLTINACITKVNALIPAPDAANPSAIISLGEGTYNEDIDVPSGCLLHAPKAKIVALAIAAITMASDSVVNIDSVENGAFVSTGLELNNVSNISFTARKLINDGTGSDGIQILGTCNDVYINIQEIICSGTGAAGIVDKSTGQSSVVYNIGDILLEGTGSIGILNQPTDSLSSSILNMVAIRLLGPASGGIKVDNGIITIILNSLDADAALTVGSGGILNIISNTVNGTITVNGTGRINANIVDQNGVITVVAADSIQGIVGNAILHEIVVVDGSIVASGTITGSV